MIEHPDKDKNTRIGWHIVRVVFSGFAALTFAALVDELNKGADRWNPLVRDYIGGTKPGDALIWALLTAGFALVAWKAHRELRA